MAGMMFLVPSRWPRLPWLIDFATSKAVTLTCVCFKTSIASLAIAVMVAGCDSDQPATIAKAATAAESMPDLQRLGEAYVWGLAPTTLMQRRHDVGKATKANDLNLIQTFIYEKDEGLLFEQLVTFANLRKTGPVVFEMPEGRTVGAIADFNFRVITKIGLDGFDKGKGTKYLVLGPGQSVRNTEGFHVVKSSTSHIYFGTSSMHGSEDHRKNFNDAFRVYAYAKRNSPPPTRILETENGSGWERMDNQPQGLAYWVRLAEFIEQEPAQKQSPSVMKTLMQIGIEKGKPFRPTEQQKQQLIKAVTLGEKMKATQAFNKQRFGNPLLGRFWRDHLTKWKADNRNR